MNTSAPKHPPNAPDPLAVALAKLDPSPHGFEWNSFMFAAGRESKARALTFWRTVSGVLAVIAGGLALALFTRPSAVPVYVDRVVPSPAGAPVVLHSPPANNPDQAPAPIPRAAP